MVGVFAGVALAAVIKGNDRANYLVGTSRDDAIYGYGGADRLHARGGPDALHLGGGSDKVHAKPRTKPTLSVARTMSVRWMGARTSSSVALVLPGPELTLRTTSRRGVRRSKGAA
jgi:Ca2+-binding RTX toxin-like protein